MTHNRRPVWPPGYPRERTDEEVEDDRANTAFIGPRWRPTLDHLQREQAAFVGAPEPVPTNKMGRRIVKLTSKQQRELMEQIDLTKWSLGIK